MATDYKIVSQKQTTSLQAGGGFVEGMAVTFETTPGGVAGTVFVPLSQYSAEHVAELVEARVKAINDVATL